MNDSLKKREVILYFLRQYPFLYTILFFVTVGFSILESVNISAFFPILNSVLGQNENSVGIFNYLEKIIAIMPFDDPFINACVLLFFVLITKEVLGFLRQIMVAYGVGVVVCDVRKKIFNKYSTSDYQFFCENKQGHLLYNIQTAAGRLGNCLQYIPNFLTSVLMTIALGALLLSISFHVTIFLLIVGLLFNFLTQLLARKISYHIGSERADVSNLMNVISNEFLDGVKHINYSGSSEFWLKSFFVVVNRFKELVIKDGFWLAIPERVMQLLPGIVILVLAVFFRQFNASSPDVLLSNLALISVYTFAFYRLVPYLTSFGRFRMQISGVLPDVEILYRLLHQETSSIKDGAKLLNNFDNEIKFEGVHFAYKGRETVLRNVTFSIDKGKTTAIVGHSGAGKSTIVNLLVRLFDPCEGKISIDGVGIKEFKLSHLHNKIGLVSQDTFIFNASIRENILFGINGFNTQKVIEAAKLANAHDFIMDFPDGYESIVGDKGVKLSGGQKQRIAIARVMLRDAQILILDEATSSLDYHSEILVQKAINAISMNRTLVVVAHRLSTIINADKIIVLEGGMVAEAGTHRELILKRGVYKALYESQEKLIH